MNNEKTLKLAATSLVGFVLLNFPFVGLPGAEDLILGIPATYGYFFAIWLILIILTAWIVERPAKK